MFASTPCTALKNGHRLELRYKGWARVVEVHTVGVLKDGNQAMNVYQVRGGSNSGERAGWKMLLFDKTFTVHELNEASEAPRTGYKRNAGQFQSISCQI
jgi:hypothetical protein